MRRVILSAVTVFAALVLQLTVVSELPWPGGGRPDLVLLAVVALSLCGSPLAGALTGFLAGFCLDIAPPGSYLIGEYALVFCLVGYGCGRLGKPSAQSAWLPITCAAVAAAAGEALFAGLGRVVGDPQVTWAAIRLVLPSSAFYDVILSPFALYLVMRAAALGDQLGREGQLADVVSPEQARAATALPGAGLLGGAGWLAGPGAASRGGQPQRVPQLRDAAARTGDGWIGNGPPTWRTAPWRTAAWRRGTPRLRPGAGQAGTAAAMQSGRAQLGRRELSRGGLSRRALSRGALSGGALSGKALSGGTLPRGTRPGRAVHLRLAAPRRRDGMVGNALGATLGGARSRRYRGAGPAGPALRGSGYQPAGAQRRSGGHGPPGSAFRKRGPGVAGSALRGTNSGPRGSAFRGPASGSRGPVFRGAGSGPRRSAVAAARIPGGAAFRRGALSRSALSRSASRPALSGSALSRSALSKSALSKSALSKSALSRSPLSRSALSRSALSRSALSRSALSKSALPGSARSLGPAGSGRSLLAGSGAPARVPRFRLDARMPGGSAFGSAARRALPGRSGTLRLRAPRRRDGVVGGGVVGSHGRRTGRPVRLRLGSLRRGDGTVGGLAAARFGHKTRPTAPRFRGHSGLAGRSGLPGRPGLGGGKQARFRSSRRSLLPAWIGGGRLGPRYSMRRIGSRRATGRLS